MGDRVAPLRFRVRERNWWVATDRVHGGQWHICRHGDGYFHFDWRGVVDGIPEQISRPAQWYRADVLEWIERERAAIAQLARERCAARNEREVCHG